MLAGLSLPVVVALMFAGLLLDGLFGEVRHAHPLVGFGWYANRLEAIFNRQPGSIAAGLLGWCLAVFPLAVLAAVLLNSSAQISPWLTFCLHAVLLYFCLGLRSLRDHCLPIAQALERADLAQARQLTQRIVSRDTRGANASDLSKAAVESLLENGNDAVFGTLFWFLLAGGAGALLFRLANTLDAMWGYRNARFLAFGKVAARVDDGLNWVPARLTALSYLVLGKSGTAWYCWRTQARTWPSPNAGPVMSSGAGSLRLSLGGPACYEGVLEMRPPLGEGAPAQAKDIKRAWGLVFRSVLLWCGFMLLAAGIQFIWNA